MPSPTFPRLMLHLQFITFTLPHMIMKPVLGKLSSLSPELIPPVWKVVGDADVQILNPGCILQAESLQGIDLCAHCKFLPEFWCFQQCRGFPFGIGLGLEVI